LPTAENLTEARRHGGTAKATFFVCNCSGDVFVLEKKCFFEMIFVFCIAAPTGQESSAQGIALGKMIKCGEP
jgi:hypothetical protein